MCTIVRILRTSELDLRILKVVRHNGELRLLHVISVSRDGSTGCFKCVHICHFMRDVLRIGRVMLMGAIERAASNGATSEAEGGGNRRYAITSRQKKEDSPDVFTGMIQVFNFDVFPEKIIEPFSVSTPVG